MLPRPRAELEEQAIPAARRTTTATVHLRYDGTDTPLPVSLGDIAGMRAAFETAHKKQFGFAYDNKPVVVEALEVETAGGGAGLTEPDLDLQPTPPEPSEQTRLYSDGSWHDAGIFKRDTLLPGMKIPGPAVIIEHHATIAVEDGWQAEINAKDHVILNRVVPLKRAEAIGTHADPVMLEVFNNLFMSIAEQMGVTLQNTAYSVNIKERLDFSCAVFDADGALVANAPHMPVHLGSMDRSVETIIKLNAGRIRPGDVFALNAPYNGGTHLPDITVVSPVFDETGAEILFWAASRGHHADVGGTAPGSMTPRATTVEEEGVLFDNFKIVDQGQFREAELVDLLTDHAYPARNPQQNVADLSAQIAANEKGIQELHKMVGHFGLDVVRAYMKHVQDNAEESVRRVIEALKDSEYDYPTDQGSRIRVKISVDKQRREATVDFTGTSGMKPNNFNAPEPVTRAAILYCFRVMVDGDIPMNAGCLKPIHIKIPDDCMLRPSYPAAVVAGNVETSQHVTNAVFCGAGGHVKRPGNHEQPHLRQRDLSIL